MPEYDGCNGGKRGVVERMQAVEHKGFHIMQFSIFSNSPNKEGAWAFMEYLLSEEEQSWYGSDYGGFPVRKEAFEAYLTRSYDAVYNMAEDHTSEETIQMLRETVEHLHMEQPAANGEI